MQNICAGQIKSFSLLDRDFKIQIYIPCKRQQKRLCAQLMSPFYLNWMKDVIHVSSPNAFMVHNNVFIVVPQKYALSQREAELPFALYNRHVLRNILFFFLSPKKRIFYTDHVTWIILQYGLKSTKWRTMGSFFSTVTYWF